ncbi:hypothetical protein SAMN02745824_2208 [Parasphingorhabdus marina DSM 22363]|uniref:Uncharacterized protein n=1 Tax=Parasphingorhabdus marina DSM 22363 TaxID=1123272 RepID=A0A1N6F2Y9_9SPHN|nr:hypothetical protein SAMN02745824_2208 [Parasphingorhabdus marina DSM 22363]
MVEERNRALALRNEGARHPFRLKLPREALIVAPEERVLVNEPERRLLLNEDVHMFVLSFLAFFTAFYLFIF